MGLANKVDRLTAAGLLVSIGIVFGDIGTSPLYTYTAIPEKSPLDETLALGGVSGIFSLYALIKRYSKYLVLPNRQSPLLLLMRFS